MSGVAGKLAGTTTRSWRSRSSFHDRSPRALACSVDPTISVKSTVASIRVAGVSLRVDGELLDLAGIVRITGPRHMVGCIQFNQTGTGNVLGQVATVADTERNDLVCHATPGSGR